MIIKTIKEIAYQALADVDIQSLQWSMNALGGIESRPGRSFAKIIQEEYQTARRHLEKAGPQLNEADLWQYAQRALLLQQQGWGCQINTKEFDQPLKLDSTNGQLTLQPHSISKKLGISSPSQLTQKLRSNGIATYFSSNPYQGQVLQLDTCYADQPLVLKSQHQLALTYLKYHNYDPNFIDHMIGSFTNNFNLEAVRMCSHDKKLNLIQMTIRYTQHLDTFSSHFNRLLAHVFDNEYQPLPNQIGLGERQVLARFLKTDQDDLHLKAIHRLINTNQAPDEVDNLIQFTAQRGAWGLLPYLVNANQDKTVTVNTLNTICQALPNNSHTYNKIEQMINQQLQSLLDRHDTNQLIQQTIQQCKNSAPDEMYSPLLSHLTKRINSDYITPQTLQCILTTVNQKHFIKNNRDIEDNIFDLIDKINPQQDYSDSFKLIQSCRSFTMYCIEHFIESKVTKLNQSETQTIQNITDNKSQNHDWSYHNNSYRIFTDPTDSCSSPVEDPSTDNDKVAFMPQQCRRLS